MLTLGGPAATWSARANAAGPAIGPGGGGPAGPGGAPGGPRKEKKEGPAEEAPKDNQALRPIESIPAQPRRRRRVQLFELHGYMRLRADYFHRPNLGLNDFITENEQPTRFFDPPAETPEFGPDGLLTGNTQADCFTRKTNTGVTGARANTRCRRRKGFSSANMRLRLEPTLHISDTVRVHAQVDLLDNIVLGSTPDSYGLDDPSAPIDLYTRSQAPPTAGYNGTQDSVRVKRGWGEIKFGFGLGLEFGRMPNSWGMGLVANHGNGYSRGEKADIIRQLDRDYGDTVDSVRLSFDFGKDRRSTHKVAVSWDWASSGPTTDQLLGPRYGSGGGTYGQAFSVEKFDNVYQWSASIERRDQPEMLQRKLSLGNPVLNYGLIGWLRYQDVDDTLGSEGLGILDSSIYPLGTPDGLREYTNRLVQRRAIVASPDVWARVNWRTLRVELEAGGNFGRFNLRNENDEVEDIEFLESIRSEGDLRRRSIVNFGYALEFKYGFFNDNFHIGFDHGFATGDTAAPRNGNPLSPLNVNDSSALNNYRFNPAYNVDLLLFREILGTVSNAVYFKPWAAFYFFEHFSARVDIEYALAARRQSTLGNRFSYGIELDAAARYHDAREPIFFQLQYGVMFPLGAFNRLRVDAGAEDARAVQSLQAQLGIRF